MLKDFDFIACFPCFCKLLHFTDKLIWFGKSSHFQTNWQKFRQPAPNMFWIMESWMAVQQHLFKLIFSKRESAEWRHGNSQCRRENTSSPMGDHWQVSKKPSPENQIRDFGRWGRGDCLASVNTGHGDNIGPLIHDEEKWGIFYTTTSLS